MNTKTFLGNAVLQNFSLANFRLERGRVWQNAESKSEGQKLNLKERNEQRVDAMERDFLAPKGKVEEGGLRGLQKSSVLFDDNQRNGFNDNVDFDYTTGFRDKKLMVPPISGFTASLPEGMQAYLQSVKVKDWNRNSRLDFKRDASSDKAAHTYTAQVTKDLSIRASSNGKDLVLSLFDKKGKVVAEAPKVALKDFQDKALNAEDAGFRIEEVRFAGQARSVYLDDIAKAAISTNTEKKNVFKEGRGEAKELAMSEASEHNDTVDGFLNPLVEGFNKEQKKPAYRKELLLAMQGASKAQNQRSAIVEYDGDDYKKGYIEGYRPSKTEKAFVLTAKDADEKKDIVDRFSLVRQEKGNLKIVSQGNDQYKLKFTGVPGKQDATFEGVQINPGTNVDDFQVFHDAYRDWRNKNFINFATKNPGKVPDSLKTNGQLDPAKMGAYLKKYLTGAFHQAAYEKQAYAEYKEKDPNDAFNPLYQAFRNLEAKPPFLKETGADASRKSQEVRVKSWEVEYGTPLADINKWFEAQKIAGGTLSTPELKTLVDRFLTEKVTKGTKEGPKPPVEVLKNPTRAVEWPQAFTDALNQMKDPSVELGKQLTASAKEIGLDRVNPKLFKRISIPESSVADIWNDFVKPSANNTSIVLADGSEELKDKYYEKLLGTDSKNEARRKDLRTKVWAFHERLAVADMRVNRAPVNRSKPHTADELAGEIKAGKKPSSINDKLKDYFGLPVDRSGLFPETVDDLKKKFDTTVPKSELDSYGRIYVYRKEKNDQYIEDIVSGSAVAKTFDYAGKGDLGFDTNGLKVQRLPEGEQKNAIINRYRADTLRANGFGTEYYEGYGPVTKEKALENASKISDPAQKARALQVLEEIYNPAKYTVDLGLFAPCQNAMLMVKFKGEIQPTTQKIETGKFGLPPMELMKGEIPIKPPKDMDDVFGIDQRFVKGRASSWKKVLSFGLAGRGSLESEDPFNQQGVDIVRKNGKVERNYSDKRMDGERFEEGVAVERTGEDGKHLMEWARVDGTRVIDDLAGKQGEAMTVYLKQGSNATKKVSEFLKEKVGGDLAAVQASIRQFVEKDLSKDMRKRAKDMTISELVHIEDVNTPNTTLVVTPERKDKELIAHASTVLSELGQVENVQFNVRERNNLLQTLFNRYRQAKLSEDQYERMQKLGVLPSNFDYDAYRNFIGKPLDFSKMENPEEALRASREQLQAMIGQGGILYVTKKFDQQKPHPITLLALMGLAGLLIPMACPEQIRIVIRIGFKLNSGGLG